MIGAGTALFLALGGLELAEPAGRPLLVEARSGGVGSWHADNRNGVPWDDRYGDVVNRLELRLSWDTGVVGARLDAATFFARPDAGTLAAGSADPSARERLRAQYEGSLRTRYRDDYTVGKVWASWQHPGIELTAGDTYATFGRGLTLALRKQDELLVDTTVRGGRVAVRAGALSLTGVAGVANPLRLDEATGQTLLRPLPTASDPDPAPVLGEDRLAGGRAEISAGPLLAGIHGVALWRTDRLGEKRGLRGSPRVDLAGASLEVPLAGIGSAYLESAWQQWADGLGKALYASADAGAGPVTAALELQHYRDFQPLLASVDRVRAAAFQTLAYSAPPTTEALLADSRFLFFDRCVTGGRARVDVRAAEALSLRGAAGRWATWGERASACPTDAASARRNDVTDLSGEAELTLPGGRLVAGGGWRRDGQAEDGRLYYGDNRGELRATFLLPGRWSIESDVRLRRRYLLIENGAAPWSEADVYVGARLGTAFSVTLGFEGTGQRGRAPTYGNVALSWNPIERGGLRLFAGQQRGAMRCVSGVCREVPPFEGLRLEWAMRL